MPRYRIYGKVVGTKYLGEFEAETAEEAIEQGLDSDESLICLCHQCATFEAAIEEGFAEVIEDEPSAPR